MIVTGEDSTGYQEQLPECQKLTGVRQIIALREEEGAIKAEKLGQVRHILRIKTKIVRSQVRYNSLGPQYDCWATLYGVLS